MKKNEREVRKVYLVADDGYFYRYTQRMTDAALYRNCLET
jgi:hypothetical protein